MFSNVEIALIVYDGDQECRRTLILKIETYKKSASQHNGPLAIELVFIRVYGKLYAEDYILQVTFINQFSKKKFSKYWSLRLD